MSLNKEAISSEKIKGVISEVTDVGRLKKFKHKMHERQMGSLRKSFDHFDAGRKDKSDQAVVQQRKAWQAKVDADDRMSNLKKKQAFAERMLPGTEKYYSERMLSILQGMAPRVWTPEGGEISKLAAAQSSPLLEAFFDELEKISAAFMSSAATKSLPATTRAVGQIPQRLPRQNSFTPAVVGAPNAAPKPKPAPPSGPLNPGGGGFL